jgi:hypothetical protein
MAVAGLFSNTLVVGVLCQMEAAFSCVLVIFDFTLQVGCTCTCGWLLNHMRLADQHASISAVVLFCCQWF